MKNIPVRILLALITLYIATFKLYDSILIITQDLDVESFFFAVLVYLIIFGACVLFLLILFNLIDIKKIKCQWGLIILFVYALVLQTVFGLLDLFLRGLTDISLGEGLVTIDIPNVLSLVLLIWLIYKLLIPKINFND